MINRRVTEGIKKIKKPSKSIKFGLGAIALIAGCLMLLIIAAFTQIKLNFSIPDLKTLSDVYFEYIPQIPAIMFIAALLGMKWGTFTVFLYVILGLTPFFPVFALGGGASYIFQYSFGYIVAYIFSAYYCAKTLRNKGSVIPIITAVFKGVFIIHIIGIIYMVTIALLRRDSLSFIYDLIYYQSLSKIMYDIVCSFIAILTAKFLKKFLWLITD